MNRYTFTSLWRPSKDQWLVYGPKWRTVTVFMDSMDRPEHAACDACLYLIAIRRGRARAVSVFGREARQGYQLSHIHFDWSRYSGVVSWGGWAVEVR